MNCFSLSGAGLVASTYNVCLFSKLLRKEQDGDCLQTAAGPFKVHRNEVCWTFRCHARPHKKDSVPKTRIEQVRPLRSRDHGPGARSLGGANRTRRCSAMRCAKQSSPSCDKRLRYISSRNR